MLKVISVFLLKVNVFYELSWKLPKLQVAKIAKIARCQNLKLPTLEIAKIESWQSWKWFQYFLLKVSIFDKLNWKLPKLEIAKIWMLRIESDLYISCQLTVLMNWIESYQNWKLQKRKVDKIESCQSWKWVQHFLPSCQIAKLPNYQVAKFPNCQVASC